MFILYILAVARVVNAMSAMVEDLRFFQMVLIKSLENQSKDLKKRGMMFLKQSNFFSSKHTYFLHFLYDAFMVYAHICLCKNEIIQPGLMRNKIISKIMDVNIFYRFFNCPIT